MKWEAEEDCIARVIITTRQDCLTSQAEYTIEEVKEENIS